MKNTKRYWTFLILFISSGQFCYSQNDENEIIFSHPSGFYDWNFVLDLHAENVDSLRYTLNGSLPTSNSAVCEGRLSMTILDYLQDSLMYIQTSPGISQPQTDNCSTSG